jgi:hypothetical protein
VVDSAPERVAPSMNPQEVANMVWALAALDVPPIGSLREALWAAAERVAPSMSPQNVANTVWALATLDVPSTGILCEALWAAAERVAPSMNPQDVANSLLAMSLFHLHDTGSSRQVTGRLFEHAAQLNANLSFKDRRQVRSVLYPDCLFDTSACITQTVALAN